MGAVLALNLTSAFHTTRLALPAMTREAGAASSTWPRSMGSWLANKSAYVAAKHGSSASRR